MGELGAPEGDSPDTCPDCYESPHLRGRSSGPLPALPAAAQQSDASVSLYASVPERDNGRVLLAIQSPDDHKNNTDSMYNRSPIPFSASVTAGNESAYLQQAMDNQALGACGAFTERCESWLERHVDCPRALLTNSCTSALEIAALIIDIRPGDEVIVPSFTFTSTANAFILRGAVPVFVDIRPDTLNIDEARIAEAISPRTRAIVPVHYAGVACEMDAIMALARQHGLWVIEDAAQCLGSTYRGRALGGIGHLGTYSFHASKNIQCGEGGALLINDPALVERAETVRDKGTTRAQFKAGKIRQYSWVDAGISAPPSELQAAYLLAQLEQSQTINTQRLSCWNTYHQGLASLEIEQILTRPRPPVHVSHNAHIYALQFKHAHDRDVAMTHLEAHNIRAAMHYEALHQSEAGKRYGRVAGDLPVSERTPSRLLRLPLWHGLTDADATAIAGVLQTMPRRFLEVT